MWEACCDGEVDRPLRRKWIPAFASLLVTARSKPEVGRHSGSSLFAGPNVYESRIPLTSSWSLALSNWVVMNTSWLERPLRAMALNPPP